MESSVWAVRVCEAAVRRSWSSFIPLIRLIISSVWAMSRYLQAADGSDEGNVKRIMWCVCVCVVLVTLIHLWVHIMKKIELIFINYKLHCHGSHDGGNGAHSNKPIGDYHQVNHLNVASSRLPYTLFWFLISSWGGSRQLFFFFSVERLQKR